GVHRNAIPQHDARERALLPARSGTGARRPHARGGAAPRGHHHQLPGTARMLRSPSQGRQAMSATIRPYPVSSLQQYVFLALQAAPPDVTPVEYLLLESILANCEALLAALETRKGGART